MKILNIEFRRRALSWALVSLCIATSIFAFSRVQSAPSDDFYIYTVGDFFEYEQKVQISLGTGFYDEYFANEVETGRYEVTGVVGSTITMTYDLDWIFSDNEGGDEEGTQNGEFTFSAETRMYISGTDAEARNAGPYVWFRVKPSELIVGEAVNLLAMTEDVEELDAMESLGWPNLIRAAYIKGTGTRTWLDPQREYIPEPHTATSEYTDQWWFDEKAGWALKERFKEDVTYADGGFTWSEKYDVTDASFDIPYHNEIWTEYALITLTVILTIFVFIYVLFQNRARAGASRTFDILSGKRKQPRSKGYAPTVWQPALTPHETLMEFTPDETLQRFADGIYLVSETNGDMVVADIGRDMKTRAFMGSDDECLDTLFKLALGTATLKEATALMSAHPSVQPAAITDTYEVAQPDLSLQSVFSSPAKKKQKLPKDPFYLQPVAQDTTVATATLLARRRFLDFAHGQAPLDAFSHDLKVKAVLDRNPSRVVLIGDDDLVSISLARKNVEVCVLELDPYTCALITLLARREKLPVTVHQLDFRDPLPTEFVGRFDLFVADPDFTIESFGLFLSRGLSCLVQNGIGLINFERSFLQQRRAKKLLDLMKVEVVEHSKEKWGYVTVANKVRSRMTGGSHYAKRSHVSYASDNDLVVTTAPFSSSMFVVRRTPDTRLPLEGNEKLGDVWIYDYED